MNLLIHMCARPKAALVTCALAILFVLAAHASAHAQWSQPNSAGHINNTNASNVVIGTENPTPTLKTEIYGVITNGGARETLGLYDPTAMGAGVGGGIAFGGRFTAAGVYAQEFASIQGVKENGTDGNFASALLFNTRVNGGNPTERVRIDSSGNLGVGTSAPNYRLDVLQGGGGLPGINVSEQNAANRRATIGFGINSGATTGWSMGQSSGNNATKDFYLFDVTANAFRLVVDTAGRVGIGTTSPTSNLHVVGNVRVAGDGNTTGHLVVDGNIAAKYQDVAEWVPSTQKLEAGTVVVLDPSASNHVVSSTSAYDTAVAGVVSEQPGLILGEGGEGKVKVATTGRVKVRVDATRAPVKIGDLLVTSDVAGVAMRSEPITVGGRKLHAPGTIIGKALEPLAGGTGEILVLLSLQ